MNELEERLRAATRAAAGQIPPEGITPWRQPAPGNRRRVLPGVSGHGTSAGWLAPASAAAAVVALVAGSLAVVHAVAGKRAADYGAAAAPTGSLPPYSAGLIYSPSLGFGEPGNVVVRATATGMVLATVRPPKGELFTGVGQGATSDQTFILTAETRQEVAFRMQHRTTAVGLAAGTAPERFFLLSFDPASGAARLTTMKVPVLPHVSGFALSPDGSQLAVTLSSASSLTVQDYSLATGTTRTWQARPGYRQHDHEYAQQIAIPAWGPDHTLSYNLHPAGPGGGGLAAVLDTATPGGDLIKNSFVVPASACRDGSITQDGNLIITGTLGSHPRRLPWMIRECAISHGRVTVTVPSRAVRWAGQTASLDGILWASPDGHTLIIGADTNSGWNAATGVLIGRNFTPLPDGARIPYGTLDPAASVAW